jgi:hypothetical protein
MKPQAKSSLLCCGCLRNARESIHYISAEAQKVGVTDKLWVRIFKRLKSPGIDSVRCSLAGRYGSPLFHPVRDFEFGYWKGKRHVSYYLLIWFIAVARRVQLLLLPTQPGFTLSTKISETVPTPLSVSFLDDIKWEEQDQLVRNARRLFCGSNGYSSWLGLQTCDTISSSFLLAWAIIQRLKMESEHLSHRDRRFFTFIYKIDRL